MPDFNKGSTFNKDANFQGVKFGADAPLLETELNELQDIQTEARADIVRDSIPSGFTQLGELDFDYMLNNENCVKLKTDSVAYVNGYKINIPKDTLINIGKAPEKDPREDLVFLEVWKEEVTKDSQLTVAGGEGQASITNNILDSRVNQETSRRIALKWRVRVVPNIDFSKTPNGLDYIGLENLPNGRYFRVAPQGGLAEPFFDKDWKWAFRLSNYYGSKGEVLSSTNYTTFFDMHDMGLFVAGQQGRATLNTVDGFVYAIPMFRLYRKPSCGKAIPFEYQKINPKVDYSKFAELMKEERVERVVSETIQGQSLVNLVIDNSTNKANYLVKKQLSYAKERTDYTVMFELSNVIQGTFNGVFSVSIENTPNSQITSIPFNSGKYTLKLTTRGKDSVPSFDSTKPSYVSFWTQSTDLGQSYTISNIIVLEGDWTNKPLPKYFTGLKSIGEDESLITVKNSILNESSYDPSTGTPKLNTVPGSNYITSDNLIMPTIEGQVKRGEVKVSDLTSFDKIDSLVGDEKVEFTRIKGRTLQNLVTSIGSISQVAETLIVDRTTYWDLTKISTQLKANVTLNAITNLFKPNTKYTLIIKNVHSANDTFCIYDQNSDSILVGYSPNKVRTFTTKAEVGKILLYINNDVDTSTRLYKDFIVLEGDYTNTPLDQLPYIEGIKSVGETENNKVIFGCGSKNLFIDDLVNETGSGVAGNGLKYSEIFSYNSTRCRTRQIIKVKPNTTYYIDSQGKFYFAIVEFDKDNRQILDSGWVVTHNGGTYTTSPNCVGVVLIVRKPTTTSDILPSEVYGYVQMEEGTSKTSYVPNNGQNIKEITLKEPLRSLPNGICDTIEGNKVIRRVGKIVLNGTESYVNILSFESSNATVFRLSPDMNNAIANPILCDTFCNIAVVNPKDYQSVSMSVNGAGVALYFRMLKSNLTVANAQGFKTWLSQNPTTVYYELANPVEELIEPNYDKESIKTYQLDQPLRSIPNGVKDEIVGNKLIRRCGEVILKGTESWANLSGKQDNDTTTFAQLNIPNPKNMDNQLPGCYADRIEVTGASEVYNVLTTKSCIGINAQGVLQLRLVKSFLSSPDTTGLKAWLQANPVKVVYELDTPIEIPLKEVLPYETNFSLARQFNYTDNYLLELPNGVKDTVEGNKVTRRVGKVIINGTGTYERSNNSDSKTLTSHFNIKEITDMKLLSQGIMSDYFRTTPTLPLANCDNIEGLVISDTNMWLNINKTRLSTDNVVGLKAWLSENPITVLYELATPVTEELSGNNNRYCPYHKEDNTYCGSMYLGNGTNDTITDTVIKSESIVIDTPFRESTGKLVVNDCKYKKTKDGYNTPYETSQTKNLFDSSKLELGSINTNGVITTALDVGCRIPYIKVKPNTKYIIWNMVMTNDIRNMIAYYDINGNFIDRSSGTSATTRNLMTPSNCYYIGFTYYFYTGLEFWEDIITNCKIQLEEGLSQTSYESFVPTTNYFENTEQNDIEDLRHQVSLTGFNYEELLNKSFDSLLRGEL